ncbi:hypothetical protein CC86DRAFT_454820 [Ophiobolus disseminans]|uniref:Uncharacterized protein n=1 Tax=Ophiobolus disseminans TaxID=1469910 RepID=A0A6A7A4D5_9PLEO|nr:hypothetical protein CC86DRAFT_454820 [Ophiobolus disseminans]
MHTAPPPSRSAKTTSANTPDYIMTATAVTRASHENSLASPSSITHAKSYFDMSRSRRQVPKFSWEEGPMQLVPSPAGASDQSTIHNCIIRAIDSIYNQAPHVPMKEHNNFTAYCLAAYQGLDAYLKTREVWADAVAQAKLKEWGNWLRSIASKRNNFNPEMCRGMMNDFMPSLSSYFSRLTTASFSTAFLDTLDKATQLPVFLWNHDTSFEGGVRAFPKGGWWTRKVAARKNKGWWKFGTVESNGEAREVRFSVVVEKGLRILRELDHSYVAVYEHHAAFSYNKKTECGPSSLNRHVPQTQGVS